MRKLLITLTLLWACHAHAADRYWVGLTNSSWNNTGNWSTSSGGAGGASVPGSSDRALFNSAGNVNCDLDIAPTVAALDIASGYTATIDLNGNNLTINGSVNNDFEDGTIDNTSGGSISITSTAITYLRGTTFNPNLTVTSSRINMGASRFNGTVSLTKNGGGNDQGAGGAYFASGLTMNLTGSGQFMTGNGNPDSVIGDLTIVNSAANTVYFGRSTAGHYVSGNVNITINGTTGNNYVYFGDQATASIRVGGNLVVNNSSSANNSRVYLPNNSTLVVDGTTSVTNSPTANSGNIYLASGASSNVTLSGVVTLTNSGSGGTNSNIYLGNSGAITCGAALNLNNGGSAATHQIYVANAATSSATITGNTTVNQNGSGTTGRIYLGNNGDVTFNGTLELTNSDASNNSQMYLNHGANSSNTYTQNITVNSTNAACDGIYFGNNGGSSTLSTGRTISIGGGGYTTGDLRMRNFTQTGSTAQSLSISGTGYIYLYDCDWGGNVTFTAPRFYSRGTRYRGTANLTKNGASRDRSAGGNVFDLNTTITNSGSAEMSMGDGNPDTFKLDLTLNNSASGGMYLGYGAGDHYVGGDLSTNNTATSGNTYIIVSNATTSTLHIEGDATMNVTGTANQCIDRFGNNGDITLDGNLTVNRNSNATNSTFYIATGTTSDITINGNLTYSQSLGGTDGRSYLGRSGNITINGTTTITNTCTATNSQIYLNNESSATTLYNGNIVIENSNASSDGIFFGNSGGSGTLAATRTITLGAGGFTFGDLLLRNFTQMGATPQSLVLSTAGYVYLYNSEWGDATTFSSGRILVRGSTFDGNCSLTKNGATDDRSNGGNIFNGNLTMVNAGSRNFEMGYNFPDSVNGDLTITNSGTYNTYFASNAAGSYVSGDITATNSATGTNRTTLSLANGTASSLYIGGSATMINSSTSADSRHYLGNNGDVTVIGNVSFTHSASGTVGYSYIASGANSSVQIDGTTQFNVTSSGGTTHNCYLGDYGDVVCNDDVTLTNSSSATSSTIYVHNRTGSSVTFNENVILNSTNSSLGVNFGGSQGEGTLVSGKTITVGGSGFTSGDMRFRNFTQSGSTAQSLTNSSATGYVYNYNSDWGGNVTFTAPRMYTRGTTYRGTASLTKTGAGDDRSAGNNSFMANTTITNSGSREFGMGDGNPDSVLGNLTLDNIGTHHIYWARNSDSNYVSGNVTMNNNTSGGTTTVLVVSSSSGSEIYIGGNVEINSTGASTDCHSYLGDDGDVTLIGNLTINNTATANDANIYVGDGSASALTIGGTTTVNNGGAGNEKYVYLGNSGSITFNDSLIITNASSATNCTVYSNHNSTSSNLYNEHIVIESTNASSDGVRFGNSQGSGTLAATKTITVGAGGFIAGDIYFRNFTQVGPTAQSLTNTGTGYIFNYSSDWGGDVTFSSGRMYTRESTFRGNTTLTKTGASDDRSEGGNVFLGTTTLNNLGSRYFGMGYSMPDTFQLSLTLNNSGTYHMYVAQGAAGSYIGGNLDINHSNAGTGGSTILASGSASSLYVAGRTIAQNTGSGTSNNIVLGDQGDITFNDSVSMVLNTTGTNGYMRMANNTASAVTINGGLNVVNSSASGTTTDSYVGNNGDVTLNGNLYISNTAASTSGAIYVAGGGNSTVNISGNTTVSNAGTGTTSRIYMGNSGDVNYTGTLDLSNSSGSTNSQLYLNYANSSQGTFADDIVVECTNASSDGILFGSNGGDGVLAAGQTVTIGPGGFVAGYLQFREFTQTGNTAHSFMLTGTGFLYNYDSHWQGDFTSTSPRFISRGTTYDRLTTITKNGAGDDQSAGGNTFTGNCILNNSGSGYLMMGNGSADVWGGDLTLNNTGSRHMYIGNNSASNSVAGNFVSNNNGTGTSYHYISSGNNSSMTIAGSATVNNSGSGADVRTYFGNSGDIALTGTLTAINDASGNNGYVFIGNGTNSAVTVNGVARLTNDGANNTKRFYVGYNGDVTFNDSLIVVNNSSANNSQFYLNDRGNSTNIYGGNVVVQCINGNTDGVYFGNSGGFGVMSSGYSLSCGNGGYIAGDLLVRNFTQIGTGTNGLNLSGTARWYPYNSTFSGDVTVTTPRYYARGATFSSDYTVNYTGSTNNTSYGGNTFNGTTTINHTGSGRLRIANNSANDYNGDVEFIQTNGTLQPAYNQSSTFAGNISVNTSSAVTFAANNGTIVIDGTGNQSFNDSGTSSGTVFRRMSINKASGEFTLNEPLEISTSAIFIDGIMNTDATNVLTFRDNSSVSGASGASYVVGPVDKIGNDAFTYPLGVLTYYRPISISAPGSGSAEFRAQYYATDPDPLYNRTLKDGSIDHVSLSEYWTLDRIVGSDAVSVTLSWDTVSGGVTNLSDLVVCRWDGSSWKDHGNGGTTGSTSVGTIVSLGTISSFSPFTLGSTTTNNPLPVDLVEFKATPNVEENIVDLFWVTASEINNDYFTVERTKDLQEFDEVLSVSGQGTTNERTEYHEVDYNPLSGVSYYRLSQTDFDGQKEFFNIEEVSFDEQLALDVELYPNPNNGHNMFMKIPMSDPDELRVLVNDFLGKEFLVDFSVIDRGDHLLIAMEMNKKLPPGSYMVNVQTPSGVLTHKLIVQ